MDPLETTDPREIVASMPDIKGALQLHLRKKHTEEAKILCRIVLAWADGQTMQMVAKNLHVGTHRVHRAIRSAVRYFNAHAPAAPSADQLVAGFLAEPLRTSGRPRLGPEIRQQIMDLANAEMPAGARRPNSRQIAAAVHCHHATVCRILNESLGGEGHLAPTRSKAR